MNVGRIGEAPRLNWPEFKNLPGLKTSSAVTVSGMGNGQVFRRNCKRGASDNASGEA